MSQNAPEQANQISQEEVTAAETAEQASLTAAQNTYLLKRVVLLRAQLNRVQAQANAYKTEVNHLRQAAQAEEVPAEEPGEEDASNE